MYASGLVLVSPLTVDVQEEARVGPGAGTVKNSSKDSYVSEVHVKVIGSRNGDFVSDRPARRVRGRRSAGGKSTVIAETDAGRYAFYRGQTGLRPAPEPPKPAAEAAPQANQPVDGQKGQGQADNNGLLDNIQMGNGKIQQFNNDSLNNFYKQNKGGVKAKEAY